MKQAKTTKQPLEDSKEGLHTQKPNFETLHIGLCSNDEDLQLINELGEHILTIESYPLKENAETIMQAVNERKALLDANKKMKEALEAIVARLNGEFDNPSLLLFGDLSDSETDDIEGFAKDALNQ